MLITDAIAQGTGAPAQQGSWFSLVFLTFVFIMFYLLLIRPQRKKQKEHEDMVRALEKGDEVIAAGGLIGEVKEVKDTYVCLRLADQVEVFVQRYSVNAILPKGTLKTYAKN
jgi:preprotein translocase subunit YajC